MALNQLVRKNLIEEEFQNATLLAKAARLRLTGPIPQHGISSTCRHVPVLPGCTHYIGSTERGGQDCWETGRCCRESVSSQVASGFSKFYVTLRRVEVIRCRVGFAKQKVRERGVEDRTRLVNFYFASSMLQKRQIEAASSLESNGTTPMDTPEEATHIITNSNRFHGWQNVQQGAAIVTVRGYLFLSIQSFL